MMSEEERLKKTLSADLWRLGRLRLTAWGGCASKCDTDRGLALLTALLEAHLHAPQTQKMMDQE